MYRENASVCVSAVYITLGIEILNQAPLQYAFGECCIRVKSIAVEDAERKDQTGDVCKDSRRYKTKNYLGMICVVRLVR